MKHTKQVLSQTNSHNLPFNKQFYAYNASDFILTNFPNS